MIVARKYRINFLASLIAKLTDLKENVDDVWP